MKVSALLVFILIAVSARTAAGVTTMKRAVVGNGVLTASSAHHVVNATVGQPVVAATASVHHTVHAGFWWPGQLVSGASSDGITPADFALRSASPNPFSRSTELRFDVPERGGHLSLRIYDVAGRVIRTLTDGAVAPGSHLISWDGSDDAGRRVGAGLYILSFRAPGRESIRKLVLLP